MVQGTDHSDAGKVPVNKPPKVLHFVWGGGSGSTRVALDLVSGHQKGGLFQPLLVLRAKPGPGRTALLQELQQLDIPYDEAPLKPKYQLIQTLIAIIRQFQPEIVVAHGYREHIYGRIAALIAKVPVIFQVEHNVDRYQLRLQLESKLLASYTNKIICVSKGVRANLVAMGIPSQKTQVIYNGIDFAKFHRPGLQRPYPQRASNIIMVARFSKQKDHQTLLEAAHILKSRGIAPNFLLVGGGDPQLIVAAKMLCDRWEITDRVCFMGRCDDIPALLSDSRIFVLATHREGLPLAILEAMAAGCAVVATDVPGVDELIIHGHTGFKVPHQDAQALAERLQSLLDNPEQAAKIAENGRCFAGQFNRERMVEEYESLFLAQLQHPPSE